MRLASRRIACCLALAGLAMLAAPAKAQLRGHGGPVRAMAISVDGARLLTGSFDNSAILWSLHAFAADHVLRFHEGAVNAVAILADGRVVTSGADARIAIWTPGGAEPAGVLTGHNGPVVALATAPDGKVLASASWDRTVRLWPLGGGEPRVLEGHQENVNGVAFSPDGATLVSAGYDATVRIWPLRERTSPLVVTLASPLNAVAVAPDGEIVAGGADGKLHFLSPTGEVRGVAEASPTPVIAIALARDGQRIAAASIGGPVAIIDPKTRALARSLAVPGLPVWSAAFLPDLRTLVTGGSDGIIRRWNVDTGEAVGDTGANDAEDPLAAYAADPGAQVFRACVACHTLAPGQQNRAGPSLHGILGRRIATLPGYNFSPALKRLEIVWTPETVAKLFEVGPAAYLPGTKMPEQRIGSTADREALVRFLERATR